MIARTVLLVTSHTVNIKHHTVTHNMSPHQYKSCRSSPKPRSFSLLGSQRNSKYPAWANAYFCSLKQTVHEACALRGVCLRCVVQLSRLEARLHGQTTGGNAGRPHGTVVATVVGLHRRRPGRAGCALRTGTFWAPWDTSAWFWVQYWTKDTALKHSLLLECDAASLGKHCPTFRTNVVLLSTRVGRSEKKKTLEDQSNSFKSTFYVNNGPSHTV